LVSAEVIATGSTGNFCIVGKNVAIDAGIPYKNVEPYMDRIKLLLLTHVHSDHFKASTIRRMALEKPLLKIGCGPFLVKHLVDAGVNKNQIIVLEPRLIYNFGICNVIPFPLYHDVPNYGYKLHFPNGKVFYATDTRSLKGITAPQYDLYMVEKNYNDDELKARLDAKMESGEYAYEIRVMKNHLSEHRVNDWLYKNMGPRSEYIYLHQHVDRGKDEGKNHRISLSDEQGDN